MGPIGIPELIIVLVILLVIFGPKRLPGLGKSLGTGMREFKDSIGGKGGSSDDDDDDDETPSARALEAGATPAPAPAVSPDEVERSAGISSDQR
jgi:sec-independent protein translocase protein TatA